MKKAIIILVLLLSGVCARAQYDTLYMGQRNPVYYYWDTNWWDHYAMYHPDGIHLDWPCGNYGRSMCKAEYARYCYTDSSLRVIGVAMSTNVIVNNGYGYWNGVTDSAIIHNSDTDYLRLYECGPNDEMYLLAEAPWHCTMKPSHITVAGVNYQLPDPTPYYYYENIYDIYFDSAVTVHDSFYVAKTNNNNYVRTPQQARNGYINTGITEVHPNNLNGLGYSTAGCLPKPNHIRLRMHLFNEENYDAYYSTTDTNWHTFTTRWYHPTDTGKRAAFDKFLYLFPIIDTSRVIPPPACYTPGGLTKVFANGGTVTLMWNGSPHTDHWQLSLCADGCEPEDGDITECGVTVATLNSLDTGRWYTARVRSVCVHNDSAYYSDWSDSLSFYMPGGGGGTDPIRIETVADRYTYLMPNPAGETVTVASSFRIGEVELYDLNGKLLARQKVDGLQAALDISALAAGTYIVRVTTNNGTAYKKLVKN